MHITHRSHRLPRLIRKETFAAAVIMCCIFAPATMHAQFDSTALKRNNAALAGTVPDDRKAGSITRNDGTVIEALIEGMSGDTLLLLRDGETFSIPVSELQSVRLYRPENDVAPTLYGMIFGMYAGSCIAFASQGTFPYLNTEAHVALAYNLAFGLAGGGLMHLAYAGPGNFDEYVFSGSERKRMEHLELLHAALVENTRAAAPHRSRKLRISVLTAHVTTKQSRRLATLCVRAGLYVERHWWHEEAEPFPAIHLFRKIQATVDITSTLSIGVAWMPLTESAPDEFVDAHAGAKQHTLSLSFSQMGFYPVLSYRPLRSFLPEIVDWEIGAGAGAVFNSGTLVVDYFMYPVGGGSAQPLSGAQGSGMLFTECSVTLAPSVSLGLSAVWNYIPPKVLAPIPGILPTESSLEYSSFSVGVQFGLHL